MSVPFTAVGSGETYDPTDPTIDNEIITAYSERRVVAGKSAVANVGADDDVHSGPYWRAIQDWIEANCTLFVDHAQAVGGNFEGLAEVPMFTLNTFRAAAGLVNGFRRATVWTPHPDTPDWETDPAFSYGKIQTGTPSDIRGPWTTADFHKALSALKWTRYNRDSPDTGGSQYERTSLTTYTGATCDIALAAALAGWSPTWVFQAPLTLRYAADATLLPPGASWQARGLRLRSRTVIPVPTVRPCAIGVHYPIIFSHDLDGFGIASGTLKFHEEWPERTPIVTPRGGAGESGATWFGSYATDPLVLAGASCPGNTGLFRARSFGQSSVLKWNFTNSD